MTCMLSSPPKRCGDFNFEKLKSLGGGVFSSYGGEGASPYGADINNGNQRGDVIQVKTIIIL